MSYNYCVVWFERAKTSIKGYPRQLINRVRVFRSLERAEKFQREFVRPYPNIYKLMKKSERAE